MSSTGLAWLEGGITAVPGILAAGVAAGIKPDGKKDLALIYSTAPACAAAVFTTNQIKGAPVVVSMEHVRDGTAQAIIASSGCSNVCTGDAGLRAAREMTELAGSQLGVPAAQVLVASTGVIGVPLPMDRVRAAIPRLVKSLSPQGGPQAAEAIMTTDTRPKGVAVRVEVGGRSVTIGGIAKGVGMIEPHMATMLCFLATDAVIASGALDGVLRQAVNRSLNRITVDGDQSTSDTTVILANGLAENPPLTASGRPLRQFARGVEAVTERLATMLMKDAEGATHLVEVRVRGARNRRDALAAARSVATSPLVKTAINGQDPNWGRIMMALGKSTARVTPDRISVAFNDEGIVERGMMRPAARLERIRQIMAEPEYVISIDLGLGTAQERVWTCDLSEEYVRINGKYTT